MPGSQPVDGDLLLALPALLLYMLVVALAGPSQRTLVLTLGLLSWPAFARVVRAQVLAVRGRPYVEAARALGAGEPRVALAHVLPATFALLPAKVVTTVRFAPFAEATLAFLGLGDPAAKSWVAMLGWAFGYPLLFAHGAWLWWAGPPLPAEAVLLEPPYGSRAHAAFLPSRQAHPRRPPARPPCTASAALPGYTSRSATLMPAVSGRAV